MKIYTRRGDDGTTGLLFGGRVDKSDLRTEAYGSTDEAVAAMGMARALVTEDELAALVLRLQRELFVVGAELATDLTNVSKLKAGQTKVTAGMTDELEALTDEYSARRTMPAEFVVPGQTQASACLDLARAIVRRAERSVVAMDRAGLLADREPLRYLNRLADLLFVLARYEENGFLALHGDRARAGRTPRVPDPT